MIRRLSYETTGMCPNGCGKLAYPYTCDGMPENGYFDAAPGCAASMAEDALEMFGQSITTSEETRS